jgi:hypothetical protein
MTMSGRLAKCRACVTFAVGVCAACWCRTARCACTCLALRDRAAAVGGSRTAASRHSNTHRKIRTAFPTMARNHSTKGYGPDEAESTAARQAPGITAATVRVGESVLKGGNELRRPGLFAGLRPPQRHAAGSELGVEHRPGAEPCGRHRRAAAVAASHPAQHFADRALATVGPRQVRHGVGALSSSSPVFHSQPPGRNRSGRAAALSGWRPVARGRMHWQRRLRGPVARLTSRTREFTLCCGARLLS